MPPDDEISSMKFAGSTLMVLASSRQEVIDLLKDDVYVKSGVWDLEKVRKRRHRTLLSLVDVRGTAG